MNASPPAVAITLVGLLSFVLFLLTDNDAQLAVAVAIVIAMAAETYLARRAFRRLDVDAITAVDATAGEPLAWTAAARAVTRPVFIRWTGRAKHEAVVVRSDGRAVIFTPPVSRGVVDFGLFDLTARGPLGLVQAGRRLRVNLDRPVHVGPAPLAQNTDPPRPRAHHFGTVESTPVGEELFRGLRDYVRGDARKLVDWKATAHHGRLMVREHDGTGTVTLRIAVKLPTVGAASEVAAARAAWLATAALREGWRVEMTVLEPVSWHPTPVFPLGSPSSFTPAVPLRPPQPMQPVTHQVRNEHDVRAALARASHGPLEIAAARGALCVVSPEGLDWS